MRHPQQLRNSITSSYDCVPSVNSGRHWCYLSLPLLPHNPRPLRLPTWFASSLAHSPIDTLTHRHVKLLHPLVRIWQHYRFGDDVDSQTVIGRVLLRFHRVVGLFLILLGGLIIIWCDNSPTTSSAKIFSKNKTSHAILTSNLQNLVHLCVR